jgi:hypothetical protein
METDMYALHPLFGIALLMGNLLLLCLLLAFPVKWILRRTGRIAPKKQEPMTLFAKCCCVIAGFVLTWDIALFFLPLIIHHPVSSAETPAWIALA